MNVSIVAKEISAAPFPLKEIQGLSKRIRSGDWRSIGLSKDEGLDNVYDKERYAGLFTARSKHRVRDSKIKHDCMVTKYDTSKHGCPVEYFYKFCESCGAFYEKRAVVFDNASNSCVVVRFN